MTVYVDDVRHQFGRMVMCHMWADTIEELLAMAGMIGVQAKWLQKPPKASWVHFDISLGKKELAIKQGAVLTDKYGPVEFTAKQDRQRAMDLNRADLVALCDRKLERIAHVRAMP